MCVMRYIQILVILDIFSSADCLSFVLNWINISQTTICKIYDILLCFGVTSSWTFWFFLAISSSKKNNYHIDLYFETLLKRLWVVLLWCYKRFKLHTLKLPVKWQWSLTFPWTFSFKFFIKHNGMKRCLQKQHSVVSSNPSSRPSEIWGERFV